MKNDNVTTVFNLMLAVLAILGVVFALQTIFRTRTLRTLQIQATQANAYRMAVESLAQDAYAYSQKNPNAGDPSHSAAHPDQTCHPLTDFTTMNESELNTPSPAAQNDLMDQVVALRQQVFTLLLALVVVSGTLTVFLYRQANLAGKDLAAIKPQATAMIDAFKQKQPSHGKLCKTTHRLRRHAPGLPAHPQKIRHRATGATGAHPRRAGHLRSA